MGKLLVVFTFLGAEVKFRILKLASFLIDKIVVSSVV